MFTLICEKLAFLKDKAIFTSRSCARRQSYPHCYSLAGTQFWVMSPSFPPKRKLCTLKVLILEVLKKKKEKLGSYPEFCTRITICGNSRTEMKHFRRCSIKFLCEYISLDRDVRRKAWSIVCTSCSMLPGII